MSMLILAIVMTMSITWIIIDYIDGRKVKVKNKPEPDISTLHTPCEVVDEHDEVLLIFDEEEAEFLEEEDDEES